MASNPQVPQGNLNRLRQSVVINDNPSLNVTSPYLDVGGITLAFGDAASQRIKTMTGIVTSGEPYQDCVVTVNLVRSQALANAWETQRQTDSAIGDIVVKTDTGTLQSYNLSSATILNVAPLTFNGQSAGYVLTIGAYLPINNDLWNFV